MRAWLAPNGWAQFYASTGAMGVTSVIPIELREEARSVA
jgi:hypothetical protein